jgi:hypothetical protein
LLVVVVSLFPQCLTVVFFIIHLGAADTGLIFVVGEFIVRGYTTVVFECESVDAGTVGGR